jgi:transposase-like protein
MTCVRARNPGGSCSSTARSVGSRWGPLSRSPTARWAFWQAVEEVWPKTRGQRCWVHKSANVLNKLPKSQQLKAKRALQEIWMPETKKDALVAVDAFVETWGVKDDKAVECLTTDRDALLAFYDFPAEHWRHPRTTNVIESSFAMIRHSTVRSKGCLSKQTRARDNLQTRRGRREKLASPRWPRNRDQIASSRRCRLIPSVTNI